MLVCKIYAKCLYCRSMIYAYRFYGEFRGMPQARFIARSSLGQKANRTQITITNTIIPISCAAYYSCMLCLKETVKM